MSGDVQPRKRKDKKRKKDDEDAVKEAPSSKQSAGAAQAATQPGDIQMHIHSDHGTGGNWCAKIVFFFLLVGLGALIGLILIENRGVSNGDTPLSESRYAEYFSGWVDENREDDHHHEDILNALNQLEEEHEDDGDGHGADDDHEPYTEEEDHDDEQEGHADEDDDADEEEVRKLDDEEVEEIVAAEKKFSQQEATPAEDDDEEDDDVEDADDDEGDNEVDDQKDINDEGDEALEEEIDQGEDDDGNAFEENNNDDDGDDEEDDDDEEDSDGPKIVDNQVDDAQRDDNDDNDATDDPVDEEGEQNDDDDEDNIGDTNDYDDDDDDDAEDEGADLDEAEDASKQNSDKKEDPIPADNDDDDDNDVGVPEKEDNDADAIAKEIENIADANDADDDDDGEDPFDEEANKLNLASKDTVGVSMDNATAESGPKDPIIVDQLEKPDISGEILKSQMDDLVENYNKLAEMLNVPKEEFFVHAAAIEEDENDDGQVDSVDDDVDDRPASNSAVKDDIDDDNDDDDDDGNTFENFVDNDGGEEEYLAKVRQEQELKNQRHQQQAKEEPREETSQISSRPSAEESYQEELDRAKRQLDEFKDTKAALQSFEALLIRYPRLVPALVGKARTLDLMAEQQQSNTILEEAVEAYRAVLALGQLLDDDTLQTVAERCINRIRFSGHYLKAVDIHQILVKRFDSEPRFRNQLAVTYLMANRLAEAKAVLHETLLHWIEDGFALVHYGFVVKNLDKNMELAAQYLQEGIETGHEGTQDGRFYFHLGDALQRLGRNKEALNVYREGANKKLFLSMYQRSLYNEDNLKSRPFWTVEQTTYGSQLELIRLQWSAIRDEGLRLLNAAGNFKDEAENLRDTGDWKQFELFSRGYRIDKNCAKAPLTCKLIEQFRAARSCKRGQVKFSVMHPGTHVWPHCGPTNCRIRAHLGLKVPSGTHIRVAEETRSWKEGEWLIFDDSYEHEVWHNGTSTRLVLIVDFWHPELSESQRRTLSPI
ncbi:aspartyl/asparaginyl beta-hydroxylase isoform X8 [Wyeomyia smithii]|uniref:aspartyl/asparaginyl beta-hydroxylase isoform X8 n=1 Tax=Wyeomyia smithii TaxID=174621 RepID=UPI002467BA7D|nr:aspartyl/asparaginyl beta-hydroxylase isoform X8 [Wyeomyia smithii]